MAKVQDWMVEAAREIALSSTLTLKEDAAIIAKHLPDATIIADAEAAAESAPIPPTQPEHGLGGFIENQQGPLGTCTNIGEHGVFYHFKSNRCTDWSVAAPIPVEQPKEKIQ